MVRELQKLLRDECVCENTGPGELPQGSVALSALSTGVLELHTTVFPVPWTSLVLQLSGFQRRKSQSRLLDTGEPENVLVLLCFA